MKSSGKGSTSRVKRRHRGNKEMTQQTQGALPSSPPMDGRHLEPVKAGLGKTTKG